MSLAGDKQVRRLHLYQFPQGTDQLFLIHFRDRLRRYAVGIDQLGLHRFMG